MIKLARQPALEDASKAVVADVLLAVVVFALNPARILARENVSDAQEVVNLDVQEHATLPALVVPEPVLDLVMSHAL